MLNPSVADVEVCDPTLNRCVNYFKSWGYGGMIIVNLFAFISTDLKNLRHIPDPVGPENDKYIVNAAKGADKVILLGENNLVSIKGLKKSAFC